MSLEASYLLPLAFGLALGVILVIYWIGGRITFKGAVDEEESHIPYACGEEFATGEVRVHLERFFVFAVYLLIFDVLIFILATAFTITGILPVLYSVVILTSAVVFMMFKGV
ncbi:hypothetical protein EU538_01145 [Candidatus Thorarchaeota archaeon]|jgi:NADH:ubiquinone oxidoreductase subunit 3 (subunit A)|nr:MAG: hypothetical protein EU538_01145 [Candidatus Thorarchaeota archaeon]